MHKDNKAWLAVSIPNSTTGTWCVDTGATNHVCNSLQGFQKTRRLVEEEMYLWLGDSLRLQWEWCLHFPRGKILVLEDCLYVPNVRRNLISVFCLACNGFWVIFNKNFISIKYDVDEICCRMLEIGRAHV